jgi:hypothetical protein
MSTKTKPRITSNVRVGSQGLDLAGLRNLAQAEPNEFVQRTQALIDKGEFSWAHVRDLKGMFNALSDVPVDVRIDLHGQVRTVQSSAFPVLSGNLTVAGINAAYMGVPTIGQDLVQDFDSVKEVATIMGLLSEVHSNLERKEGEPYALVGAGEERFDIGSNPKGLRMQITQEMIDRNDVENVVQRVNFLGEVPAEEIEESTLKEVTDHDGSAASGSNHVLTINKTGTQLYNATANNPGTRAPSGTRVTNNALVDTTDLEAARTVLAAMLNSRGKRIAIPISECVLLVPDALEATAQTILNSTLTPGVANEQNPWGPQGSRRPKLLSTPKLDALSSTAWYLGNFKKQFRRKWGIRMEMVTMSGDLTNYLRSRIAFEARVAWDCKVGATDYVYVVQSLAASTAPKED